MVSMRAKSLSRAGHPGQGDGTPEQASGNSFTPRKFSGPIPETGLGCSNLNRQLKFERLRHAPAIEYMAGS
jgi:hypothetical protein